MALLFAGLMSILQALSTHLVTGDQYFTQLSDGEWVLSGQVLPTAKANAIAAAWADILLYGSQVLDQMLQTMVAPSVT